MSHEIHANYEQTFLLPPSIDEFIGKSHPARFIKEFVDSVDLTGLGFVVRDTDEGRPNYAVELLTKVWVYGYFEKIRTSRGLEKMCYNNLGMLWLTGMNYPDHNTIWRFYRNNKAALRGLFKKSVQVAYSCGFVGLVLNAVDGTRIVGDVSRKRALHRASLEKLLSRLDEGIDDVLQETENSERETGSIEYNLPTEYAERERLREEIRSQLQKLDNAGTSHLSTTDEDCRMMKCYVEGTRFAYNAQAVVDDKLRIVVAADVVQNETDNHQLTRMVEQVEENIGEVADETVADAGYYSGEELAKAGEAGYEVLVNLPDNSSTKCKHISAGFDKSKFTYNSQTDTYTCPKGGILAFCSYKRGRKQTHSSKKYRCKNYKDCEFSHGCNQAKQGRTITIPYFEKEILAQKEKQKLPANMGKIKKRKAIVEPVFGIIKRNMGFRRWTVRGLDNVRAQWALVCTVFNLKKLYKQWAECPIAIA